MQKRLEIKFVGDVPADEFERAAVLANPKIAAAIEALAQALEKGGVAAEKSVSVVRKLAHAPRSSRAEALAKVREAAE